MSEYRANEELQNTYGAYVNERARWAQVLGTTGKRKQAKPARVSFLARIVAAIFN
jgi:hypothetical protein